VRRTTNGKPRERDLDALWAHSHTELRDPHHIVCQWKQATDVDARLLEYQVRGAWWDALDRLGVTLIVTREYEHLVMAFCVHQNRPRISYLHLPHPSGLAVDPSRKLVYIASTRNPNMVFDFAPCSSVFPSGINGESADFEGLLLPVRSRYLPGRLYLHDLAMIRGELYANAVGANAVVRLPETQGFDFAWWPRSIDSQHGPRFDKNYLQLNSISAGSSLKSSFFTASTHLPANRRPGHLNFPVDRRGVVFSGQTREVICSGLTRPHSARPHNSKVWVDNSGYGELGFVTAGRFEPVYRFDGWTRGLGFREQVAFVGTSRVIPKYRRYAPGLRCEDSECGVHAFDVETGRVLGSLIWPHGNQIFGIEALDRAVTRGFPFSTRRGKQGAGGGNIRRLFSQGLTEMAVQRVPRFGSRKVATAR
jgi:uncharacterized protein (TIGR03032 family)